MGLSLIAGSGAGAVARLLAKAGYNADGTVTAVRTNTAGEQDVALMYANKARLAEEGSLFVGTTPTPGTGVALGIAAATQIVATAPSLLIMNSGTLGGTGVNIIMDKIKLTVTGAGTAGTYLRAGLYLDIINRYTSGGGTVVAPKNLNSGVTTASIATIYDASTAIVAPAASASVRLLDAILLRSQIPVIGDVFTIDFGGMAAGGVGTQATTATNFVAPADPVIIAPGHSFLIYLFSGSQSGAPTYEYKITWIER